MNFSNLEHLPMDVTPKRFALGAGEASLVVVKELLDATLKIPNFQRPYDWRVDPQVEELGQDLRQSEAAPPLFVGLIVLARDHDGTYVVVDGQQRLTSLLLFFAANGIPVRVPLVRHDDQEFLRRLVNDGDAFLSVAQPQTLSQRLLAEAFRALRGASAPEIDAAKTATCIAYVAPRVEGATLLFERINMRGRKVSQFDLVKNRLIGWAGALEPDSAHAVMQTVSQGYSELYRLFNPSLGRGEVHPRELDADRLLRVHWILFATSSFKSSDRVIEMIEQERDRLPSSGTELANYIRRYVDSMVDVSRVWVQIMEPGRLPDSTPQELRSALNEFVRLNRTSELDPLLVSVLLRFGFGVDSARFVRLCGVAAFRDALAKRRSNRGRSPKWTIARLIHQNALNDARGQPITSVSALAHHFFWKTMSWWDVAEIAAIGEGNFEHSEADCASTSLHSASFYQEFGHVLHYFFWEYALMLRSQSRPRLYGAELAQGDVFGDDNFWRKFRETWDIEHVFPARPDFDAAKTQGVATALKKHEATMRPHLNQLGNLTIVPRGENRGVLSNSDFVTKREEMIHRDEVLFNRLFRDSGYIGNLMNRPFWGPNNCRRRSEHLVAFANARWGTTAIQALGVGPFDERVDFDSLADDENDDDDE